MYNADRGQVESGAKVGGSNGRERDVNATNRELGETKRSSSAIEGNPQVCFARPYNAGSRGKRTLVRRRAPSVPSYVDMMKVKTGNRQVPIKTNCKPPGWEKPTPVMLALTDIIMGPNSQMPRTANR